MAFKRRMKPPNAAPKGLCGILTHSRRSNCLRSLKLWSLNYQTQKFSEFVSGEFDSHCVDEMKFELFELFLSHSWLPLALCEVLCPVQNLLLKCLSTQGFRSATKTIPRYTCAFILTQQFKNTSGERPSAFMVAPSMATAFCHSNVRIFSWILWQVNSILKTTSAPPEMGHNTTEPPAGSVWWPFECHNSGQGVAADDSFVKTFCLIK